MARFPRPLALALVAYLAAGALLLPLYAHQINADGISYLSIAQKYLHRDWGHALNGYWSPLFSWLLTLPLALHVKPLLAAKLLNLIIGAAALTLLWRAFIHLRLRHPLVLLFGAAVMVLHFAYTLITPDLLSATLVLACITILLNPRYWRTTRYALALGLLVACAYLAKSYNLPFMLVIVTATHLAMLRFRKRRPLVLRKMLTALTVAILVSSIWVLTLSIKYGRLTIGTSGPLNHALFGPTQPEWPPFTDGLFAPPNPTAISAWEDPGLFTLPVWSPTHSRAEFRHQLRLIKTNTRDTLTTLLGFSILSLPLIAFALWRVRDPRRWCSAILLITLILYPAGYLLVCVEIRYLWPMAFLLILLAAASIRTVRPSNRPAAMILVAASFAAMPVYDFMAERSELRRLRSIAAMADQWAPVLPARTPIAADSNWHDALYLAFHRNLRFHGETRPGATPDEIEADLAPHDVRHFLVYRNPAELPFLQSWHRLSLDGEAPALYAKTKAGRR